LDANELETCPLFIFQRPPHQLARGKVKRLDNQSSHWLKEDFMAKETDEKRMATDITMEFIKRYSVSPKDRIETLIDTWKKIYEAIKES
jgi:hypothetical protein